MPHRYEKELAEYRSWCHIANLAVKESGIAEEDSFEKVTKHKRCVHATSLECMFSN